VYRDAPSKERDGALLRFVQEGGLLIWIGLPKTFDAARKLYELLPVDFAAGGVPSMPTDGRNLLVNGDFEDGVTGWKIRGNGKVVEGGPSGQGCCMHISDGALYEAAGPNLIEVQEGDLLVFSFDWRQMAPRWGPNLHTGLEPRYPDSGKYPRGVEYDFSYFGAKGGFRVENHRDPVFYQYTYQTNWRTVRALVKVRKGLRRLRLWQVSRSSKADGYQIDNVRIERIRPGAALPPPPKAVGNLRKTADPLLKGIGLESLPVTGFPPFTPASRGDDRVLLETEQGFPLAVLRKAGRGTLVFFPMDTEGAFFPRYDAQVWEQEDTDAVWLSFWRRVFALARGQEAAAQQEDPISTRPPAGARISAKRDGSIRMAIAKTPKKDGWRVGEEVRFVCKLNPDANAKAPGQDVEVRLAVWDHEGRVVHFGSERVVLRAEGDASVAFDWRMPDLGTAGWFFWVTAECHLDGASRGWTYTHIDRFKKYSFREELQWSAWTRLEGKFPRLAVPSVLRLFEDGGLNALGHDSGVRDQFWARRRGMRQYAEVPHFGGIDNLGWPENSVREFIEKKAMATWPRILRNSVVAVASYGEEPGYGPAFGTTWHWGEGPAPKPASLWLRRYLRQVYGDDISRLNTQWGTNFGSFEKIDLEREYSQPGRHWHGLPKGYKLPQNLSRHVDTHAFYHWYFRRFNHTLRDLFDRLNPASAAVMSMDNNFLTQLDTVGMYNHWLYPKEWTACYYAYQRQFARDPAGFIMNWGFFDDLRINAQLYLLSLMQGATVFSFWYDVPLQFNPDLTHTRASLYFRRLRERLSGKEASLLHTEPYYDREIGIYIPLLDWKASMGRPAWMMGVRDLGRHPPWAAGYGGFELQFYSALCESGYSPRFVGPQQFDGCKIIFMPYCEAVPRADATALRGFVHRGGTLVASPKLATRDVHGKPSEVVPGGGFDEVFGFVAEPKIRNEYGQLKLEADSPIKFPAGHLPGGEPYRLQSFGHQKLTRVANGVSVAAKHNDGEPAILLRGAGKGAAVYLNFVYFWPEEWYTFFSQGRESFRVLVQALLNHAGIRPASWFLEMSDEHGSYAETSWAAYPYVVRQSDGPRPPRPTSLRLYADYRQAERDAKLVLRWPVRRVHDVLNGRGLPMQKEGEHLAVRLRLKPAEALVLSLIDEPVHRMTVATDRRTYRGGETVKLTVSLLDQAQRSLRHVRPVTIETRDERGRRIAMLSQHVTVRGRAEIAMPLALNDSGVMTVLVTEASEGLNAQTPFQVAPHATADQLPARVPCYRRPRGTQLAGATDAEFLGLLRRLRSLYLSSTASRWDMFAHLFAFPESRHATLERLWRASWPDRSDALRKAIASGETFILLPEDLGVDPLDGRRLYPHFDGRQIETVEALMNQEGAGLYGTFELPDHVVIRIGSGALVLARTSPDLTGWNEADLQRWRRSFQEALRRLGVQDDGGWKPSDRVGRLPGKLALGQWLSR